ncbi:hypothetical protein QR680_000057 [Steinernema hermaphroditum]|uniref:Ig-like domain-containing protein n=1 Tax=Steinernema hermaphroditum TaxID=289476 RepID=A0AA39LDB3_9BILA|nr:hypothetical protein QR680_000057 [Steinernema hermaphroditum]
MHTQAKAHCTGNICCEMSVVDGGGRTAVTKNDTSKLRRTNGQHKRHHFAQVAEFSLIPTHLADNRSAHIVTGSHFSQIFRLGYKLVLICTAEGDPRPMIKWYKEGAEMHPKNNVHYYEKPIGELKLWSKLEVDPATMGDQGVYACVANNQHGVMAKNFKAEYTY